MSGTDWTLTPNLGLYKPVVDADLDMWGDHLNLNADILDQVVQSNTDALAGYLPLSGGSLSGGLGFGSVYALSRDNMTRHLMLYSTTVGIAPTNGLLNYNVPATWGHLFRVGGTEIGYYDTNGLWMVAGKFMRLAQNASNNLDAVPLQQLTSSLGNYVNKSGDQMQGILITQPGASGTNLGIGIGVNTTGFWSAGGNNLIMQVGGGTSAIYGATTTTQYLPMVMNTGATLTLAADAVAPLQAVTLRQMQAADATYAPINSPTFTGTVTIPSGASIAGYAPLASPALTGTPTVPTAAVGTNTTQAASAAFVQTAVAPALHDVGRNLLHNGLFNVQQRGAGPWTANATYTADRWLMLLSNDTMTVVINPIGPPDGATPIDEAQTYYLLADVTGSAASGSYSIIEQHVEGVARTANKTVTVSFFCGLSSGTAVIGIELYQFFGTGGPPSVVLPDQYVTVNASWTRYSATFDVPSINGKTVGPNGDDYLTVRFFLSDADNTNIGAQTAVFGLWGFQLEYGNVATPLEKRDPQQELALCQRFFSRGRSYIGCYTAGNAPITTFASFPVQMRASPTINFENPTYGNAYGIAAPEVNLFGAVVTATGAADGQAAVNGPFTASADL